MAKLENYSGLTKKPEDLLIMAKLENFSGLTKKQEDLLKNHYCFGSVGLLNINVVNKNLTFHTRLSEKTKEHPLASAWIQLKNDLLLIKGKKRNDTSSHYKLEVTPAKLLTDFKAIFECKLLKDGEADPSISAEYNHSQARGKLTYFTNPSSLKAQVTVGKPEFGAGLDVKLQLDTFKFSSYNTALWWFKDETRLVFKHIGKDVNRLAHGDFEVSYYQELSSTSHLGSKVITNWKSKATTIEVGGDYQYDANTLLKGKINSDGDIGLALSRKLSENLRASVATQLKSHSLLSHSGDSFKFGVRFDFSS